MEFTPLKLNIFLFFKLPSAFWSGVRVKSISKEQCVVTVKHRWFNQNPFKSMYFAVQAMAAELTTGALVMMQIKKSGKNISMLVANNNSNFSKKTIGFFLSIFALMSPLGVLISDKIIYFELYGSEITAVIIGIFFHISTIILFESSENHNFNLHKFLAIMAGILLTVFTL